MSEPNRAGVPIADAAEQLSVTIELLRKRAQRGTVPAYKVDGRWFVVLDTTNPIVQDNSPGQDVQDVPSRTGQYAEPAQPPRSVTPAAMTQLEAIRDEWLQPLIDQLKDQAKQIGRLEGERDELRAEVELFRAMPQHHEPEPETRTDPLIDPRSAASGTETAARYQDTLHTPSWLALAWSKLRGRS